MKSWLLLLACNLMWALQFTCIKLVEDQVGPLFTVVGPMFFATLLLIPFVLAEGKQTATRTHSLWSDIGLYAVLVVVGDTFPARCWSRGKYSHCDARQQRRPPFPGSAGLHGVDGLHFSEGENDPDPLAELWLCHRRRPVVLAARCRRRPVWAREFYRQRPDFPGSPWQRFLQLLRQEMPSSGIRRCA